MEPLIFVVGGITAVGLFLFVTIKIAAGLEEKRQVAMKTFADELGLEFYPSEHSELLASLQHFKVFAAGRAKKMHNVIVGETELARIAIFDYQYTTGSGKNQTTHRQTIVAMQSPALNLPSFTMRREHFFDSVGSMLGLQDIDFDHHPKFSAMYVLKGENESAIREFFDTELLDFFSEKQGASFEANQHGFIFHQGRQKPEQLRPFLEDGYSVYAAFTKRQERS